MIVASTYGIGVPLVLGFAGFALYYAFKERKNKEVTTDFFITARKSHSQARIAWSYFASAMGAWVLFGPASYAVYAGWLGLALYALCSGLPIVAVAYCGPWIQAQIPDTTSLSDYVGKRFGPLMQYYVFLVMIFNMGVGLTAEYTSVGDLFEYVVGTSRITVVVFVGTVTSIYTAWGGLSISIITDQVQGVVATLMLTVFTIYVAATFSISSSIPLPPELQLNFWGYSSIAVMPISLMASTVFNEGFWQRAWAAESLEALHKGAIWGNIAVIISVFLFGMFGALADWAGEPSADANLAMFAILGPNPNSGIVVLVVLLGLVMDESAVDSYQNALVAAVSTVLLPGRPVIICRILVFLINIPCVVLSLQGYDVISLFLAANFVTTTSFVPLLLGLVETVPLGFCNFPMRRCLGQGAALFACLLSLLGTMAYAIGNPPDPSNRVTSGLMNLYYNCYCYDTFMVALGLSIFGTFLAAWVNWMTCPGPEIIKSPDDIGIETPTVTYANLKATSDTPSEMGKPDPTFGTEADARPGTETDEPEHIQLHLRGN